MFNKRVFSKGFCKVGDLFKFVCNDPRMTELQLNIVYLITSFEGLVPFPVFQMEKNMTSNISEVLLKTIPFNGVVYSDAEVLYSKKDLRSPYFRNIKTTYSENEV